MGKWMKAIIFIIGSAFLTQLLPTSFFRNIDTMIHEFGHAVVTLALSGRVMSINLYADHSGVTYSSVELGWRLLAVALAGYMTASLFAWLMFILYAKGKYSVGIIAISIVAALSLVLFVRNSFGMMWLGGLITLNTVVWILAGNTIQKYYFLLLSFLSLEESVLGPITLLRLCLQHADGAGDAAILAAHTPATATIWSIGLILFSLFCAKHAVMAFVGRGKYRKMERSATPTL